MKVYRISEKGQVTIPTEVRERLGIDSDSLLEVWSEGNQVRMRKVGVAEPLSPGDPIWELVGSASSGVNDVSARHDLYIAKGESSRWQGSSPIRVRSTRSSTKGTRTTRKRSRSSAG
jgi:AbrB family looped-hinge helix DNA binding protein